MKLILVIILLSFTATCLGQKKQAAPPGTVRINDSLFCDITEVANVHWREYIYHLLDVRKDTAAYLAALPDTMVWFTDTSAVVRGDYSSIMEWSYFRHPAFNYYPVAGVSYEQAIAFCKWRTYVVNQGIYFKENKISDFKNHLADTFPIRVYYRLPMKSEWEMIAAGKYSVSDHPYGYPGIYSRWRGHEQENFNCVYRDPRGKSGRSRSFYTSDTKSFFKNSSGTYCMIGNLAEMVLEKGIAKGGSFSLPVEQCRIDLDQSYTQPASWLGLRCVAVLNR